MEEETSVIEMREQIENNNSFEKGWSKYLAITTAIIAVFSAIASLQSGNYSDRALLEKNNAVLLQNKASDQWNYYQAKGVKKNVAEGFATQNPSDSKAKQQIEKYSQEQSIIQKQAQDYESQVEEANKRSEKLFEKHHKIALGVSLFQIAVALSAMSALLQRKSLWYLSILGALGGLSLLIYGIIK